MDIFVTQPQFRRRMAFFHDPSSRLITGHDADSVWSMIRVWDGTAILYGTQPVLAPDPLGSSRDMAVMLSSWGWKLPPYLLALLPPVELIPDDAVA